jgi:hypothetical protein
MHCIGVDYHKKYSYVMMKDREGKVEQRGKVNNTREEFRRLHSSLEYLRPVDYYLGNPQALLTKRKTKLREAAARRKEVNRGKKEIRLVNGAPELGGVNEEPKRQRRQGLD